MSNLTIVNILLSVAIFLLVATFSQGMMLFFVYSIVAVAMAATLRHQLLPDKGKTARRR
jgi:hypothetical protein